MFKLILIKGMKSTEKLYSSQNSTKAAHDLERELFLSRVSTTS